MSNDTEYHEEPAEETEELSEADKRTNQLLHYITGGDFL